MIPNKLLKTCRKAEVKIRDTLVGFLEMVATDEFSFSYHQDYLEQKGAIPISLTLPLSTEPFLAKTLHPFFDNLLFEGYQFRLAERAFGLSRTSVIDRFYLLMATGEFSFSPVKIIPMIEGFEKLGDEKGESSLTKLSLESPYEGYCPICLKPVKSAHRACHKKLWGTQRQISIEAYEEEPINIFKTIVAGQSISGAQRKALFHLNKNYLTRYGSPTHMLKPDGDFAEMPANEHLTMAAAKEVGFNVPDVGLYRVDGIGLVYVIKKFGPDHGCPYGSITEDFNQLTGELAEDKENSSLEEVAIAISRFSTSSKIENREFYKRVLFCFLIGNGDMHLKNWSLTRNVQNGLVKFSPVYDFLGVRTFFPQERVESILSMGTKRSDFSKADFVMFGTQTLRLDEKSVSKIMGLIPIWQKVVLDFIDRSVLSHHHQERYQQVVNQRAGRLGG